MNDNFNVKEFYLAHKKQEEKEFSLKTGLSVRHSFQSWDEGQPNREVFYVKKFSKKECFGINNDGGTLSYLIPETSTTSILLLFDSSAEFIKIIEYFLQWKKNEIDIFGEHAPLLVNALKRGAMGNPTNECIFIDENMVCIAKRIGLSCQRGFTEQDFEMIQEQSLNLLEYRIKSMIQVTEFEGYTTFDKFRINISEGLSLLKAAKKIYNLYDFISSLDDYD